MHMGSRRVPWEYLPTFIVAITMVLVAIAPMLPFSVLPAPCITGDSSMHPCVRLNVFPLIHETIDVTAFLFVVLLPEGVAYCAAYLLVFGLVVAPVFLLNRQVVRRTSTRGGSGNRIATATPRAAVRVEKRQGINFVLTSQRESADAFGVSEETVSRWETGECRPNVRRLPQLIAFLGYSPMRPAHPSGTAWGSSARRLLI